MNHPHTFDRKSLLVSALLIVVIVMIAGGMAVYVLSDPAVNEALILTSAAFRIDELYRDEVDWKALIVSARQGMFEQLDRYSTYYQPEQFENLDEELTGSYSGIGVSVIFHEVGLMIMSVRENGPANEVGLLSGDIVVSVDSVTLENLRTDESIRLLRGEVDALRFSGVRVRGRLVDGALSFGALDPALFGEPGEDASGSDLLPTLPARRVAIEYGSVRAQ